MGSTQSTWGQIKNIKLHIVTDIKDLKMEGQMEDDWGMPESGGELVAETPIEDIKLFGKWNPDEVQVSDISLTDYIAVKEKNAVYLPHTAARYAQKRFRKAQWATFSASKCTTNPSRRRAAATMSGSTSKSYRRKICRTRAMSWPSTI